ncbi:HlyD family secretion protein [Legionella beliardensis]|uniref:HlyD family secretion protein n=1 Tax=Legionella beliardensis TaxID=91822 RepID=A0A378I4R3_9GAMM|nr:efflux RND transporter periplasmic adaptor subunit [Legionella beliardensis]STX29695.1 HlyD family secretion protein [Legionella beliardensis]
MHKGLTPVTIFIFSTIILLLSCNSGSTEPKKKQDLAVVEVAYPLKKKLVDWDEYTGRFQAIEEVEIRSRVSGYLMAIKFKDGQFVKKGDVLFIIDPRPFEYALARAQAQFNLAKNRHQRVVELHKKNFVAAEVVDQRLQDLKVTEAQLKDAQVNLEYTEIRSPISGKISRYFVSVGNLIRMNETILTKIVSIDPIHFYFDISQLDLLKYTRLRQQHKGSDTILVKLPDEKDYLHRGRVDFQDNIIDSGTGTIQSRAVVSNPNKLIYPGLFGRARLAASSEYEALLLPDQVINTEQTRQFVYVVNQANQVERVYVELGPLQENGYYIIRRGLKGNELVVINGIQSIQSPNQKVKPITIKLTGDNR